MNNNNVIVAILGIAAAIAFVAGIELLVANVVQWAWNLLVPSLLHGPSITYPMAIALCVAVMLVTSSIRSILKISSSD